MFILISLYKDQRIKSSNLVPYSAKLHSDIMQNKINLFHLIKIAFYNFILYYQDSFYNHVYLFGIISRTALHWACKQGYLDVAALLLKNGADKNLRSEIGETPASVCSNQQILYLLGISGDNQRIMTESSLHTITSTYNQPDFLHTAANLSKTRNNAYNENKFISTSQDGLI